MLSGVGQHADAQILNRLAHTRGGEPNLPRLALIAISAREIVLSSRILAGLRKSRQFTRLLRCSGDSTA